MSAAGLGRGGAPHVAGGGTVATLLDQLGTGGCLQNFESPEANFIKNGTDRIEQWTDTGPGAEHQTQTGPTNKPLWEATGAPNSNPCVMADGTSDYLVNTTVQYPDPNPDVCSIYAFVQFISWAANDTLFSSPGTFNATCAFMQFGSTPDALPYSGTVGTGDAMTLGTWYRVYMEFHGSGVADNWDFGGTPGTSTEFGGNAPTAGRILFARSTPAQYCNARMSDYHAKDRALTPGELAAADAYIVAKYGGLSV